MVDRRRPNRITYRLRSRRDVRMTITVIGASIGAQFINGDPNRYEWRGSYGKDGRRLSYHTVSSRDSQDSRGALAVAKHKLSPLQPRPALSNDPPPTPRG